VQLQALPLCSLSLLPSQLCPFSTLSLSLSPDAIAAAPHLRITMVAAGASPAPTGAAALPPTTLLYFDHMWTLQSTATVISPVTVTKPPCFPPLPFFAFYDFLFSFRFRVARLIPGCSFSGKSVSVCLAVNSFGCDCF
jgi:hypothetical protein